MGWRGAIGFFASNLILGEVASALAPKPGNREISRRLPIFAAASRPQRIYGAVEVTGLISDIDEDDEDWLKVTYSVADHPCDSFLSIRLLGVISGFSAHEKTKLLRKTQNAQTPSHPDFNNRVQLFWNLTGIYDKSVNDAAGITNEDKKGEGVAWICVWYKRDKWFLEKQFTLDGVRFKIERVRASSTAGGENVASAIAYHLQTHLAVTGNQIDAAALANAEAACNRVVDGYPMRINGAWQGGDEYRVLQQLVDSMDGAIVQSGDKYFIYASSFSDDSISDILITEDKIIENEVLNSPLPEWDDQFNIATATFVDGLSGESISTPKFTFTQLLAADNHRPMTYSGGHFNFLATADEVKRVILQRLARKRYSTVMMLSVFERDYPRLKVWDLIRVYVPSAGLNNRDITYRIMGIVSSLDGKLDVLVRRENLSNWYPALIADGSIISPDITPPEADTTFVIDDKGNPGIPDIGGVLTNPTNFKLVSKTTSAINFSWDRVDIADGYTLESNKSPTALVAQPNSGDITYSYVRPFPPGATIVFTLFARKDTYKTSGVSLTVVTTSPPTPPTKIPTLGGPGITVFLPAWNFIQLRWAAALGSSSYEINWRKKGAASWTSITHTVVDNRVYSFRNLPANTTYQFRVRGVNSQGHTAWTAIAEQTTGEGVSTPPPPPTINRVSASSETVIGYSFSKTHESFSVEVEYREQGTGTWLNGFNHSWRITGLKPSTTYELRFRQKNFQGWSAWSQIRTATTEDVPVITPPVTPVNPKPDPIEKLATPSFSYIKRSGTVVNLRWGAILNAVNYEIIWQKVSANSRQSAYTIYSTVGRKTVAGTSTTAPYNSAYSYSMRALGPDPAVNSDFSSRREA